MKNRLIIIRGSSASGKTEVARYLVKELRGKIALLSADEFRWVMTALEQRDEKDFSLS